MVAIDETRVVKAPADRVWEVVSDVDKDTEYWSGLSSIRNLRKEENFVEREVTIGFMGRKGLQRVKLTPKESVELEMAKGPLKGSRVTRLTSLEEGRGTRVDVSWNFEFSGVPGFAQQFVRSQLERGTKEALVKIAARAEGDMRPASPASGAKKRRPS
jgi:ribosome-associated toxin RatA of RatAB toxin-antitoxin module